MGKKVTVGGDRLGAGQKVQQELHNYEFSTFNLERDFKSSMAPGVLYPFLKVVGTNHDTFDIDLDSFMRTIPTRGPLFGAFKFQLDLFNVPFRLYNGILHNNPTDIGLEMNQVYLPKIIISTIDGPEAPRVEGSQDDDWQINNTALEKYLGLSGIGQVAMQGTAKTGVAARKIQCIPELAYYDIFKNYYANKQEEKAYVITPGNEVEDVEQIMKHWKIGYLGGSLYEGDGSVPGGVIIYPNDPNHENATFFYAEFTIENLNLDFTEVNISWKKTEGIETGNESYDLKELQSYIQYNIQENKITIQPINWTDLTSKLSTDTGEEDIEITKLQFGFNEITKYVTSAITLTPFTLKNIDKMRSKLLSCNELGDEFIIRNVNDSGNQGYWENEDGADGTGMPYSALVKTTNAGITWNAFKMNGLCVKTYQSDIFNNWLDSEFIDGTNGINKITAVAVTNGSFTLDSLAMSEKVWKLMNRILMSGNTYEDWQEARYGEGAIRKSETPMYVGGMSAEIMFEEVVSSSETNVEGDKAPLGSLGGKGTQVGRKGGNNIHVKFDEPGYLIGICSLTPRICYSQGNDWDRTELDTMDDLHAPELDGIGFQDLIVEKFAWWNTVLTPNGTTVTHRDSAGKQIAWLDYMTDYDRCYGDFATTGENGYAFMVLNRHYDHDENNKWKVADITTYIDPAKYNYAFAYDKLDAQNFWCRIHSFIRGRRKMASQQIPNL